MKRHLRWFLARLDGLLHRHARERDLDAELRFHLDEDTDERASRGLTLGEAERAARRSLGNLTIVREDARATWVWPSFESVLQDVRFGLRGLRRRARASLAFASRSARRRSTCAGWWSAAGSVWQESGWRSGWAAPPLRSAHSRACCSDSLPWTPQRSRRRPCFSHWWPRPHAPFPRSGPPAPIPPWPSAANKKYVG